jgi:hypothetical protein
MNDDLGSGIFVEPGRDGALVGLDDPSGDRHSKAGALRPGGGERFEEIVPLLGGNAGPVVSDRGLAVEVDPDHSADTTTGSWHAASELSSAFRKIWATQSASPSDREPRLDVLPGRENNAALLDPLMKAARARP